MMNVTHLFKCLTLGMILASVPLLGGCGGNTGSWQEEVKLSDGRVITVTQKRRYESVYTGQDAGNIERESWLTFKLPEFGDQEITWHENLYPIVLNLYNGKLYLVSLPPSAREFIQYGKPQPPYVAYLYQSGKWQRIPATEIPEAIYDTNMWLDSVPPNKTNRVNLKDKEAEMKKEGIPGYMTRIDLHHKSNM